MLSEGATDRWRAHMVSDYVSESWDTKARTSELVNPMTWQNTRDIEQDAVSTYSEYSEMKAGIFKLERRRMTSFQVSTAVDDENLRAKWGFKGLKTSKRFEHFELLMKYWTQERWQIFVAKDHVTGRFVHLCVDD